MSNTVLYDVVGRQISVGDLVYYRAGGGREIRIGQILDLTTKLDLYGQQGNITVVRARTKSCSLDALAINQRNINRINANLPVQNKFELTTSSWEAGRSWPPTPGPAATAFCQIAILCVDPQVQALWAQYT